MYLIKSIEECGLGIGDRLIIRYAEHPHISSCPPPIFPLPCRLAQLQRGFILPQRMRLFCSNLFYQVNVGLPLSEPNVIRSNAGGPSSIYTYYYYYRFVAN